MRYNSTPRPLKRARAQLVVLFYKNVTFTRQPIIPDKPHLVRSKPRQEISSTKVYHFKAGFIIIMMKTKIINKLLYKYTLHMYCSRTCLLEKAHAQLVRSMRRRAMHRLYLMKLFIKTVTTALMGLSELEARQLITPIIADKPHQFLFG